jgi:hypothetical protein
MKHDWTDGTIRNVGVDCLYMQLHVLLVLTPSLNILFRNLYFILKTKYTLSIEFVLAQVRGNNHWRTSQVPLKILNYRTLNFINVDTWSKKIKLRLSNLFIFQDQYKTTT